jgi:hypothetical protein
MRTICAEVVRNRSRSRNECDVLPNDENMCSFLRREYAGEILAMFHTQANYTIEAMVPTQYGLSSGPIKHVADAGEKLTCLYRECY